MIILDEELLDQFRGPGVCEYCKKQVRRREPHHYHARGMGGGSRLDIPENLIALCAAFSGGDNCHQRVEDGNILRCDLLALIAARLGLTQKQVLQRIYTSLGKKRGYR